MPVRGEGAGIAEQVAKVQEDIRNLQRLPGAVIPPPPVTVVEGGLGGMREEMWASVASSIYPVGTAKSTSPAIFDWSGLTTVGDSPPRIDPDALSNLVVTAEGFHLVRISVNTTAFPIAAGRSVTVTVRLIRDGVTQGFIYLPHAGTFDDGVPQSDQRTVGAHLLPHDVLLADVYNTALPSQIAVTVALGLSRIGRSVSGAPMPL